MQPPMERPTDPGHIAYPGSPQEMWWSDPEQKWVPAAVKAPKLDALVGAYSAIRDARSARKRLFEEEDAKLEADQQILRAAMLAVMNATGAKSIATDHGTAYRSEKVKVAAADWNAVYAWVAEDTDRFELIEKRLKSTFVQQYMEDHDGAVPPGVNVHREYEVSVRRPTTPKST